MKRENFVSLVMGTVGLVLFALGMCMCMVEQWRAFQQGVALGVVGLAELIVMLIVRRKMQGKPPVKVSAKTIGTVAVAVLGALTLGVGMCMTMVWNGLLVQGVIVGLVGILLLLSLIPLCRGLK